MSETVEKQYDRWAAIYDLFWRHYTIPSLTRLADELALEPTHTMLNIGCGTGELERLLHLRDPALRITGVDLSEKMLEVARQKLAGAEPVRFTQASATALPFNNDAFDLVVTASALHYFRRPEKALREMSRVVGPSGRVVVMDWSRNHLPLRLLDVVLRYLDPAYHRCYTEDELRTLMRTSALEVQESSRFRFGLFWEMLIVSATPA